MTNFKYRKKDGTVKDYAVIVTSEKADRFFGFSREQFEDAEWAELEAVLARHKEELKGYVTKGMRHFLREGVINEG